MPRRSSARQSHLSALAGHAVHSFHAKRSAAWPELAELLPVLHRSQCRSVPTDGKAFTSIYHLVSHTDALYTKSPLGRLHRPVAHIGSIRLSRVQHAPSTHYQPQCGRGVDCPARWLALIKSRRRRSLPVVQLLWRRPQRCMNKSVTSSLLGASEASLPRSTGRARTYTIRAQQSVTMIATMGWRLRAQTPAAQRMSRKSF